MVVVSSGLHGVEGFFGSAIQLAWLGRLGADPSALPPRTAMLLLHAINPWGFAWQRRCDEDNIDLNRNYLKAGETYRGAPPGYAELNDLLNPRSPPSRLDAFRLRAAFKILRYGLPALKRAIAVGQYDHPAGLFYGGSGPATSTRIIQENFAGQIATLRRSSTSTCTAASDGLPRASYCYLQRSPRTTSGGTSPRSARTLSNRSPAATAYPARGIIGHWLRDHLAARCYRFLGAEFGTHPVLRVLSALRAENRAWHYGRPGGAAYERARAELLECFCPASRVWRTRVVDTGLRIIEQAVRAVGRVVA